VKENLLFHSVIHEAAASDRLGALLRKVIEIPLVYKSFYWYSPEQKLISQHYHRQLTRALRVGDAERAELIMKEHVLEARDFLLAQLRPGGEDEAA
jgi:DNA-binding GntR family transcriptional regulator